MGVTKIIKIELGFIIIIIIIYEFHRDASLETKPQGRRVWQSYCEKRCSFLTHMIYSTYSTAHHLCVYLNLNYFVFWTQLGRYMLLLSLPVALWRQIRHVKHCIVYCLPDLAAFSAVDAQVQNEFATTGLAAAHDQYQLSARWARRWSVVIRLDIEFEDKTERGRAQSDDVLHVGCEVRRRVVQQHYCIAHTSKVLSTRAQVFI